MGDAAAAGLLRGLDRAHQALMRQRDLQFGFAPPPAPPHSPAWLKPLFGLLKFLGPVLPYLFWGALALGVGSILVFITREMIRTRRAPYQARSALSETGEDWRPAPAQARALLAEADLLAEQGLFEEAAHLILLRSIEDIQSRRPRTVRPSLTSRDISALPALPAAARDTFAGIAVAVERSHFGGATLDREGFGACRNAYEALADSRSWA